MTPIFRFPTGRRSIRLAIVILALLIFSRPALAGAYPIDRLTVGTTMAVGSINIDDYYFGIMRGMLSHRGLVQLDRDGGIAADMAESWQTDDARRWVFRLRPGLLWHDGVPLTADDVRFSLEYLLAKIPVYQWHFKMVDRIEAVDDRTVVIRLTEANPRFLFNLLVLRVLPRHIFEDVDEPRQFHGPKAAVGSGPYVFKGYDNAAGVVRFEAFEQYHRGKPKVREVVFRLFKNPDTLYLAFRKGDVDLPYFYATGTDPIQLPALKRHPEIRFEYMPNPGIPNMLFFNLQQPLVDDPTFRRALSYAIDYSELINLFDGGAGTVPNRGFLPPGSLGYIDTEPFVYDPLKARQILDELGYRSTGRGGSRQVGGKPLSLEIVVRTDTAGSLRLAERLKYYWAAVGVELNIRPVDNNLFRQISDKDRAHSLMLSRTTPWGMMMGAGSGSGYLDSRNIGWSVLDDPVFQSIVDRMNAAIETASYITAAQDMQSYCAENIPVIPLFWNRMIQPYHQRFSGWVVNPMYGFLWEETWFQLQSSQR